MDLTDDPLNNPMRLHDAYMHAVRNGAKSAFSLSNVDECPEGKTCRDCSCLAYSSTNSAMCLSDYSTYSARQVLKHMPACSEFEESK